METILDNHPRIRGGRILNHLSFTMMDRRDCLRVWIIVYDHNYIQRKEKGANTLLMFIRLILLH